MHRFTFADIFSGIGGFRKGVEALGGTCVLSVEQNKFCKITQSANYENTEEHVRIDDIEDALSQTWPEFDLLCAGPPCQAFSSMGARGGFNDPRGRLFLLLAEMIKKTKPKAFLIENVRGLLSHDSGNTFRHIVKILSTDLGYTMHWDVVDSSPWVAQRRRRLFIAGFRNPDVVLSPFAQIRYPDHRKPVLGDVLETSPDSKYAVTEQCVAYVRRRKAQGVNMFNFYGPHDQIHVLKRDPRGQIIDETYRLTETQEKKVFERDRRFKSHGHGFGVRVATLGDQFPTITTEVRDSLRDLVDDTPMGKYEPSEDRLEKFQEWNDRYGKTNFGPVVQTPKDQCITLVASQGIGDGSKILLDQDDFDSPKTQVLNRKNRRPLRVLTPRECARCMGFELPGLRPWMIPVSDNQAYKQLGNAVVVPVIEAIGRAILPYMKHT